MFFHFPPLRRIGTSESIRGISVVAEVGDAHRCQEPSKTHPNSYKVSEEYIFSMQENGVERSVRARQTSCGAVPGHGDDPSVDSYYTVCLTRARATETDRKADYWDRGCDSDHGIA